MASIKVGIVGYGNSTKKFHIPFISAVPELEIYAIFQRAEAPADPASAPKGSHCTVDFPNVKHYRTAEDFFADKNIDLVVVVTRTDTHASFAKQALEAGKHAIVDKPFARSSEEADEVIRTAEKAGKIITCFQNRRWDGDFQTLLDLQSRSAFGTIKEAEIHYDFENPSWLSSTPAKHEPGGGMAFGLGTHSVYHAFVLFGRPRSVTAFFRVQRGAASDSEDSFTIILQYGGDGGKEDLLVTVKTAITTPMERQLKYWVRGTEGSWIKWQAGHLCPQESAIDEGVRVDDPGFGTEPEELRGRLVTYEMFDDKVQTFDERLGKYVGAVPTRPGRWVGLYENLAGAILGREELLVRAGDVRDCLRVLEMARESHERGVTVMWE